MMRCIVRMTQLFGLLVGFITIPTTPMQRPRGKKRLQLFSTLICAT